MSHVIDRSGHQAVISQDDRRRRMTAVLQSVEQMLIDASRKGWHGRISVNVFIEDGLPVRIAGGPEQSIRL